MSSTKNKLYPTTTVFCEFIKRRKHTASEVRQTGLTASLRSEADTKEKSEQLGKAVQDLKPSMPSCHRGQSSAQVRRKPAHR